MIFVIKFKKHITGVCIFGIIICKLGYWLKPSLIVLFKADKTSKIGLYCTILVFCLPVGLKMKCGRELSLDTKKVEEQEPELEGK